MTVTPGTGPYVTRSEVLALAQQAAAEKLAGLDAQLDEVRADVARVCQLNAIAVIDGYLAGCLDCADLVVHAWALEQP